MSQTPLAIALERIEKCRSTRATELDLSGLGLDEIPPEVFELTWLEKLNVSRNWLSDMNFLKHVPNLISLDCGFNKISDLSYLQYAPNLTSLSFVYNQISDLSPMRGLSALNELCCDSNPIQDIATLDRLILSSQLTVLTLYNTPQLRIPSVLLGFNYWDDCIEDIKHYRQAILTHGSVTQKQLKIQLVGNGRVGKTTLATALETGKPVEQDCLSTHGITIKTIPFKGYDDEIIDLNLWDFGGQEIYHATHRLFLANDCVYLLLWAEETEEDSNEMRHPPSYWLEAIRDLGGNSPVIIIKNQIDRAKSKSYIPVDINPDELEQKHEFVGISAKKYQGMYKLRGIIDELLHDPDLQTKVELPNSWVAVQTQLVELKTSCKTISFTHFQQLCQQAGIDYADWFVDYLHRIAVLFYRENAFHNQIILDQNWAIDAAYRVFDPQGLRDEIEEKRGRFKGKFARLIWSEVDDTERQIYLSFMHQCGVCYEPRRRDNYEKKLPFAQREFIVPALLPKTSKAKSAWGELREDDWQLEIEYPFLHRSIIERLILRLGETYESEAWCTGIFCETEFGQLLLESITPNKITNAGYLRFMLRAKQQSNVLVQVLRRLIKEISPHQRYKTYLQQGQQAREELPALKDKDENPIASRLDSIKPDKTIRLFISYSRKDHEHKLTLEKHLRLIQEALKRKVMLTVWSDNRMDAGEDVNEQILPELRRADLIVLLVSANFLDPERYSFRVELPIALERFKKEQTPVIPVILYAVNWQEQLGHLTVATKENADPLEDWRSPHKFWQSVENGIRAQVEKRLAMLCEQDD